MKIKELNKDVERYLLNDCYCPHEIYSFDGFCYQLFYEDQECVKLGERCDDGDKIIIACVSIPEHKVVGKAQVVLFFANNDKIIDALRYDATENNIELTKFICANGIAAFKASGKKFDEYDPGSTAKNLKELLSIADAVMYD